MTQSPEARIAVLETKMSNMETMLARVDERTERLDKAYTLGQGAWKATMKMGAIILGILGGLAWLFDHLPQWLGRG